MKFTKQSPVFLENEKEYNSIFALVQAVIKIYEMSQSSEIELNINKVVDPVQV